jgi:hypothetical protein
MYAADIHHLIIYVDDIDEHIHQVLDESDQRLDQVPQREGRLSSHV